MLKKKIAQAWGVTKKRLISPLIYWARFTRLDILRILNRSRSSVATPHGRITVLAPNAKCFMRARSILGKEPETIGWIDRFDDGDVLWDIGANIGQFTLYAGANQALTVLAFEPSPASFAVLCENIDLNRMRVDAYCLAFDDTTACSRFEMKITRARLMILSSASTRPSPATSRSTPTVTRPQS